MEKSPIVFLAVPDFLYDDINRLSHQFELDPAILLPVELQDGEDTVKAENLSLEMILSGMLRIISTTGGNNPSVISACGGNDPSVVSFKSAFPNVPLEWIKYYRRFVLTVKPEIFHEFTGASIVKAENGEFDMAL